jgi:RluA family pseudouridine synthase
MAKHVVRRGDIVEVQVAAPKKTPRKTSLLYQDHHLLVANKPCGILTNGKASLESELRDVLDGSFLAAVHRLDRDTTGCVLFARSGEVREALVEAFKTHDVHKIYHAIIDGSIAAGRMEIDKPLEGRTAVTRIERLDANQQASHIKVLLLTGRTHQIRKHMAAMHHPVLGDKKYATGVVADMARSIPRQMLHAREIAFKHPVSGKPVRVRAPLPEDFRRTLKMLRLR